MDAPTWTELEPYLDQVLDTAPAERDAWLTDFARTQPRLATALRQLLQQRDALDAQGFLETPLAPPAPTLAGVQIGAYTIRSLIGRGGMGEVWLAERSDGRFEGQFALKFLDAYATSAAGLDRFRREGRLLARLAHEHIARLLDAGVTTSERPYLVLEYVEGERIDRYCDSHDLSVAQRVRLVLDVLAAVAHAHANLVVHRDIKPSNVLVTAGGSAKLLDFGIAKLVSGEEGGGSDEPTRIEDAALTPEYAAPEQILGETASTATDVYQLGVLLFVLLAGRLPLAAAGESRAARIKAALDAEPPRLSDAAPAGLRRELRGDIDAIVAKALRKLPRERYATAVALADDLTRYLERRPVAARADVMSYRVARFLVRYRGPVISTALAALTLIGITAFALRQMHEAQQQRDVSRAQARRAERQSQFATLMLSTVGERPTTAAQLVGAGEKLLQNHFPNDPVFRVNSMIMLAARYFDLGDSRKGVELVHAAAAQAEGVKDPLMHARVECSLADVDRFEGHLAQGQVHLDEGFRQLRLVPEPEVTFVTDCLQVRAEFESDRSSPSEAIATDREALTRLEQAGETADERYPSILGRVSDFYKQLGDPRQGYEYARRALESTRANGQDDTDSSLTNQYNVGSSLVGFGELKEGCQLEGEVLARYEATRRELVTAMAVGFGGCRLRVGDAAGALQWQERAQARADAGDELSLKVFARYSRIRALIALKRLAEADRVMHEIDELARQSPQTLRDMLVRAEVTRAELRLAEGRLADAHGTLDPLVLQLRAGDESVQRLLPNALMSTARLGLAEQRFADAAAAAREARQIYAGRARDVDNSADVGEAALLQAQALDGLHDAAAHEAAAHEAAAQAWRSLKSQFGEDSPQAQRARALIS